MEENKNNEEIKILELFGGIGAIRKAFIRQGIPHKVVDFVEIDKYAVDSYNAMYNEHFEPQDITQWDKDIDVDFIMHGSPCFVAGTKILTDKGYKNIEDIQIGDSVLTHTNNFNKVIDFGSDGEKPIYKLETSGTLPIYCTDNHPFYIRHKNKVWNNQLRKYEYTFSEPEKVRLYNLTKNNNYIGVPIIPDKKTKFTNLSEEALWLLGRYVSDGYYYNETRKDRPSNTKYTCICVGNNKIQDFENHVKTYKYNIDDGYKGCKKYRFGVEFTNIVIDYNFKKGAINKNIPLEILQLPKDKLKIFLDGYMSGDGCRIKNTSIYQATTISRELAESLVLAVQKVYNIGCRIYYTKRPKKCMIEGRIVNQNDTYMIRFDLNPKKPQYLVDTNCIWYPIKKISNTNTIQTIYNMTVDKDHTYTANNCYVGNCQDFSVAGRNAGGDKDSGTRSSLMYETIRIVEKLKPKYVIWENVKNLLSKKHKHNYDAYTITMSQLGYNSYGQVLNAKDYGIPQNRERIYTVSIRKDIDDKSFKFPKPEELKLRLKDMLEDKVDEKYYLSDAQVERIKTSTYNTSKTRIQEKDYSDTLCARDWKDPKCVQVGNLVGGKWDKINESCKRVYSDEGLSPTIHTCQGGNTEPKVMRIGGLFDLNGVKHQAGSVYDKNGISPTLETMQGGNRQPSVMELNTTDEASFVEGHYDNFVKENGYIPEMFNPYNESEINDVAPTITTQCGSTASSSSILKAENEIKIVGNYKPSGHSCGRVVDPNGITPTIMENHGSVTAIVEDDVEKDIDNPLKGISGQSWQFEQNVYSEDSKLVRTIKSGEGSGNIPKVITHNIQQQVKVRKYPVDTEKLVRLLKKCKEYVKISNNEIAEQLEIPVTQVEHYFRTDDSFAIPNEDIWPKLKELLKIETDEFDESIMTFELKENNFDSSNRVYGPEGIAPTLDTSDDKKILEYKGREVELPAIGASRGRNPDNPTDRTPGLKLQQTLEINTDGVANTLTSFEKDNYVVETDERLAENNSGIVVKPQLNNNDKRLQSLVDKTEFEEGKVLNLDTYNQTTNEEVSQTLTDAKHNSQRLFDGLRIRKLTPKECWRLMGFDDEDFDKAAKVNSNTQLYKQAGNSIVVNVLEKIILQMFNNK